MRGKISIVVFSFALFTGSVASPAGTITFHDTTSAGNDSGVNKTLGIFINGNTGSTTTNYATQSTFLVDSASANEQEGFVKFPNMLNSGGLPAGATVNSATLTLYDTDPSAGSISLYQVKTNSSSSMTWSSWAGGAGGVAGTDYAASPVATFTPSTTGSYSIDVTPTVQNWEAGQSNYGWILINNGTDQAKFADQLDATSPSTYPDRPTLTVDYTTTPEPSSTALGLVAVIAGLIRRRRAAC